MSIVSYMPTAEEEAGMKAAEELRSVRSCALLSRSAMIQGCQTERAAFDQLLIDPSFSLTDSDKELLLSEWCERHGTRQTLHFITKGGSPTQQGSTPKYRHDFDPLLLIMWPIMAINAICSLLIVGTANVLIGICKGMKATKDGDILR